MNIAVSRIVDVKVLTSPTFPQRKGFGLLNIVGKSARLPVGDRARFYSNIDGVAADFSGTDEEYKAAQIFFSQSPRPTQLMISRRFDTGAPGELLGGLGSSTTIATYNALNAAKLSIPINGATIALTLIDLSLVTTLTGVASAIQAKLTTALPGATITWNGQRFIVQSPTVGIASSVGFSVDRKSVV